MDPSQLFSAPIEPEFATWLRRFNTIEQLFACRDQLFAKLSTQQLEGSIEEGVVLVGPIHISSSSVLRSGTIVEGPVIVGPGSAIGYGVKILGPTFIGTGVRVKSGTVLSNCLLMNGSDIAESCIIQNCIIGSAVKASAGCLVGEQSGVGEHFATCVGDHAHLGLGCIVSPGAIISKRQRVPAGAVIHD
jgi:NDP-sugar pyrophosphorylase family protein